MINLIFLTELSRNVGRHVPKSEVTAEGFTNSNGAAGNSQKGLKMLDRDAVLQQEAFLLKLKQANTILAELNFRPMNGFPTDLFKEAEGTLWVDLYKLKRATNDRFREVQTYLSRNPKPFSEMTKREKKQVKLRSVPSLNKVLALSTSSRVRAAQSDFLSSANVDETNSACTADVEEK
jgi:hypothetical protein